MSFTKTAALSIGGILGTGTPATAGAYYWTQRSIWDELSDDVIPELHGENSDNTLDSLWATLKSKAESKSLEGLKTDTSDSKGNNLKRWCFDAYKKIYWDWFHSENSKLKSEVKEVCSYAIKDKMNDEKIEIPAQSSNTNESTFKDKIEKVLKVHDGIQETLEKDLIEIKNSSDPQSEWKKLEDWCKKTYEKGYQGEKSNRWKLVQKFCKK